MYCSTIARDPSTRSSVKRNESLRSEERRVGDWSSDVCSSDLIVPPAATGPPCVRRSKDTAAIGTPNRAPLARRGGNLSQRVGNRPMQLDGPDVLLDHRPRSVDPQLREEEREL